MVVVVNQMVIVKGKAAGKQVSYFWETFGIREVLYLWSF